MAFDNSNEFAAANVIKLLQSIDTQNKIMSYGLSEIYLLLVYHFCKSEQEQKDFREWSEDFAGRKEKELSANGAKEAPIV